MKPPGPHRFWQSSVRRVPFWLGLFVACFLAWAWWKNAHRDFIVNWPRGDTFFQIVREKGNTFIASGPDSAMYFREHRVTFLYPWSSTLYDWSPIFENLRKEYGVRYVKIPDSLVFFSFVGLWGGWLALSDWRRKTRVGRVEEKAAKN